MSAEWEAEIKVRRNGRLVKFERALGSTPETALYNVHNDIERWAQAHHESIVPDSALTESNADRAGSTGTEDHENGSEQ